MPAQPALSFAGQLRSLSANFWYANLLEMFERLAFFGVRAISALYLVKTSEENGLGLSYEQKGLIYGIWAFVQCIVPMVSGGYSDRYGYRKSLVVAFTLNIIGYLGMAWSRPVAQHFIAGGWDNAGYWVFLAAALCVATGTAIFKPPVQGTVAKLVTEETSSMGFGIFYWLVNIGGALAPMGAAWLRGSTNWHYVFYAAALVTLCNFLPTFLLYREPDRGPVDTSAGPFQVFASSMGNILRDSRLIVFLAIFSCFWFMFMQLWDLLPNFIDEWVRSRDVAPYFAKVSSRWVEADGRTKPEMIINLNAFTIVLLVIPVSWLIRRLNKLVAMVVGMGISLVGGVAAGATDVGLICCVGILIFSLGEMICSPTFGAYVGLIAPPEKKALYMGYSNIPFALGWGLGNAVSGPLYRRLASKFDLARDYLQTHLGMTAEFAHDAAALPKERVLNVLARAMQTGDGADLQRQIAQACESANLAAVQPQKLTEHTVAVVDSVVRGVEPTDLARATQLLWDTYHPYVIWYYLGIIGLAGTIGMILFYFVTRGPRRAVPA